MRIFRPFRSATVLISLRNQPPICAPVLPAGEAEDVVLGEELVEQVDAAAMVQPGVHAGGR